MAVPSGPYCNSDVKMPGLDKVETKGNIIYLGIAVDRAKQIPFPVRYQAESSCRGWLDRG